MTLVAYESFLMLSFGIQSVLDGRPESSHCCLMSSKTSSVVCFLTQSFISLFKLRHFHTTLKLCCFEHSTNFLTAGSQAYKGVSEYQSSINSTLPARQLGSPSLDKFNPSSTHYLGRQSFHLAPKCWWLSDRRRRRECVSEQVPSDFTHEFDRFHPTQWNPHQYTSLYITNHPFPSLPTFLCLLWHLHVPLDCDDDDDASPTRPINPSWTWRFPPLPGATGRSTATAPVPPLLVAQYGAPWP